MVMKDWALLLLGALASILAAELISWSPKLSDAIRRAAVFLMPSEHRERVDEEWRRVLDDSPGAISKLITSSVLVCQAAAFPSSRIQFGLIRIVDLTIASAYIFLVLPLALILALLVKLESGGPVLYSQTRLGRGGQPFGLLKFRTMHVDAPDRLKAFLENDPEALALWRDTGKLLLDPRLTALGSFLRKTGIDEIPQIINIFVGQMSMVGPRPVSAEMAASLGIDLTEYGAARPGLTSPGRLSLDYHPRKALLEDIDFAKSRTVGNHLLVMLKSVRALLFHPGRF